MAAAKSRVSLGLLLSTALILWASGADAYPSYRQSGNACVQCHPGFLGGFSGPDHQLHVGASQMTIECLLCHTSVGDIPQTGSSGVDGGTGLGCSGCHAGPGLRLHHTNAGAPADGDGLLCVNCHPSDPTPPGEDVLPPYYVRADVNITDSCEFDTAVGGEDYSGDDFGLDNDGDLAYDLDDTDCGATTTTTSTTTTTTTTVPTTTSTTTSTVPTTTTTSTTPPTTTTTSTTNTVPTTTTTSTTNTVPTTTTTSTTNTVPTTTTTSTTSTSAPTTTSTTPTTTTSSTTTSTTLPPTGCPVVPSGSCIPAEKATLSINESKPGNERFKAKLQRFGSSTTPADFGDPVSGSTSIATCVYDESNSLVAELSVDAGGMCDGKPCWKSVSDKGFDYKDSAAADDGVKKLQARAGDAGKGKLQVQAANKASKGQNAMPVGAAAALQGAGSVRLQVVTSDSACFDATLNEVKKADGEQVSAKRR